MAFTVQDYHDFVRLLAEHPEWRPELRRLVLSDDMLTLPEIVRELAEAQRRTEQRLERLEAIIAELAEAQKQTEKNLALLTFQVQQLTESQRQMEVSMGKFRGQLLELKYRDHIGGYFGHWLKRARAVAPETLEEALEATLSHEELLDVLRLDLLVSGRLRDQPEAPEVWLAVEVAAVLDESDVERAQRRAALLRRAGYRALPLVAGESLRLEAEASARIHKVAVVQDGRGFLWEETLAAWESRQDAE